MAMHLTIWDVALILVVSLQSVLMAYIANPRWKAFMLALPFPFTMANLALHTPVDASNALGLVSLVVFTQGVRLLHQRWRLPIVPSIMIGVAAFFAISLSIKALVPGMHTAVTFYASLTGVVIMGAILLKVQPPILEPEHRETLPVWIKLPLNVLITSTLVLLKSLLGGFMTLFPMVGVFAAYEGRHSLTANCRVISAMSYTFVPMLLTIRLVQGWTHNIYWGLAAGWVTIIILLYVTFRQLWRQEDALLAAATDAPTRA
jgi:hypothetical protein